MERRRVLMGTGTVITGVVLSGCLSGDNGTDANNPSQDGELTTTQTTDPSTPSDDGDQEEEAPSDDGDQEAPTYGPARSPGISPGGREDELSPTYTVGPTGDYNSLSDAIRVAESGDVIGLQAGEYNWTPNIVGRYNDQYNKKIIFKGQSPTTTTLNISMPEGDVDENLPGMSNLELHSEDRIPVNLLYNCRVGAEVGVKEGMGFCECEELVDLRGHMENSVANVVRHPDKPAGSEFVRDSDINVLVARWGNVHHSKINKLITGSTGGGDLHVYNCRIHGGAGPSSVQLQRRELEIDENTAITNLADEKGMMVYNNKIYGKMKGEETYNSGEAAMGGIYNNEFHPPENGSISWYIDGPYAINIIGNAFLGGGDLRLPENSAYVDRGSEGISVYSEEQGIGNYYSAWDKADPSEDDDGDGVIDLPRPIPGSDSLTDRYPLAEPNSKSLGLE